MITSHDTADAKESSIVNDVLAELHRARVLYPKINSPHEGHSIIEEEYEELWAEVKKKPELRNPYTMRKEAIQVAAMAMRFIHDLL